MLGERLSLSTMQFVLCNKLVPNFDKKFMIFQKKKNFETKFLKKSKKAYLVVF